MAQIAVIIPVYNVEFYLRRCVDSILNQTFTDFELILVDDGSPDGCPAICDEYAARDSRVHVIHQENGGLSAARNAGIDWAFANSDSQWIMFVDSDDWVHPKILETLFAAAQTSCLDIAACRFQKTTGCVDDALGIPAVEIYTPEDYWTKEEAPMIACAKLYKKTVFCKLRYPIGKLHEDEFVTYKALFASPAIAVIPAPMYYYFQNPSGITKSVWTGNRMDAIAAQLEQISFFKENGHKCAYTFSCNHSIRIIVYHMELAKASPLATEENIHYLQKTLRKIIITNARALNNSKKENLWIYEIAFPIEMKYYWYFQVLKSKVKNLFRKQG